MFNDLIIFEPKNAVGDNVTIRDTVGSAVTLSQTDASRRPTITDGFFNCGTTNTDNKGLVTNVPITFKEVFIVTEYTASTFSGNATILSGSGANGDKRIQGLSGTANMDTTGSINTGGNVTINNEGGFTTSGILPLPISVIHTAVSYITPADVTDTYTVGFNALTSGRAWIGRVGVIIFSKIALTDTQRQEITVALRAYHKLIYIDQVEPIYATANTIYSLRKLNPNYNGNCVRIRRSNDNAEMNIGFVGKNIDVASVNNFVGSNSAFITTIYNQSGNGNNMIQVIGANQFRLVEAGVFEIFSANGKYGIRSLTNVGMSALPPLLNANEMTVAMTARQTGSSVPYTWRFTTSETLRISARLPNSNNDVLYDIGGSSGINRISTTTGKTVTSPLSGVFINSVSQNRRNFALDNKGLISGTPIAGIMMTTMQIMEAHIGTMGDFAVWGSALSASQRSIILGESQEYYGL